MQAGKKPALLVVDIQQALIDKRPWKAARLLKTVNALLAAFRERGLPVIYIRHDDGPGTSLAYGAPGWQVAREVVPLRGERVFDKTVNSAFLHTGLDRYLERLEVDTLVIAGLQTEYCIDATIKSAFERGYRVFIPEGGVSTFRNGKLPARKINRLFYRNIWAGRYGVVATPEYILKEAEKCR